MNKTPEIGRYLDAEEKAFIQAFETGGAPPGAGVAPERKHEIEAMARATMTDERAKISLRSSAPNRQIHKSPPLYGQLSHLS